MALVKMEDESTMWGQILMSQSINQNVGGRENWLNSLRAFPPQATPTPLSLRPPTLHAKSYQSKGKRSQSKQIDGVIE